MTPFDTQRTDQQFVLPKISNRARFMACLTALWLAGCSTPPPPPPPKAPAPLPPPPAPVKVPVPVAQPVAPPKPQLPTSNARTPHEYRVDAAKHLYKLNGERIFKGRLPPMLYAVGVLDVEVDKQGQVTRTYWVRAPGHAPEVMKEIEKTVRLAAPYPVPAHMSKVVYSDVWLWHKSGRFQLDTLTEGQD
jgi:periplasmic protein TonB